MGGSDPVTAEPGAHAAGPVPGPERSRSLDIVRGVAVFGLIWVNAQAGATTDTLADRAASWLMFVLAAGKFWTLFSILFGVTLALLFARAATSGKRFGARWLWRMTILFAIGVANAILFFPGDILRPYALAGMVLLLFHRLSQPVVLLAAVLFWLHGADVLEPSRWVERMRGQESAEASIQRVPPPELRAAGQRMGRATRDGTYLESVTARADWLFTRYRVTLSSAGGPLGLVDTSYLALFLFGLYGGRRWLRDTQPNPRLLHGLAAAGLLAGLPLSIIAHTPALAPDWLPSAIPWTGSTFDGLARQMSMVLLACAYLGFLLTSLKRDSWQRRLRWLAPVGRMGLTNYVMQLAILTTLQSGYGFGLMGKLGSLEWTLAACAIFLVQIPFSNYWLRRFSYGPLEGLWRGMTYWQPARRNAAAGVA